jgi:Fe-S-cluster-containing dehydrogenase component/formate-dependent nitrite reductase membrane component NrfD
LANLGFIIDNRRCIGCHACTVACKSEHNVPVGVNRTWVKYIEKGEFPNSRRLFSVMRCNHCDDAPCVEICPVTALYRREDGVVDFDNRRCIGCKACMQACPYDALYIDPQTNTAAKCNYCAHRVDVGLEPACVVVCPTQAIISGDLDDPNSHISQLKSRHQVSARKVEKGTLPKLFYIDGDTASLDPLAAPPIDEGSVWNSQVRGVGHHAPGGELATQHALDRLGQLLSLGEQASGVSPRLVEEVRSTLASPQRRAYDAPHKGVLWGWPVTAYLWTKALAAGSILLPVIASLFHFAAVPRWLDFLAVIISVIFLCATGALLVLDLDQPKRFLYVLLRPQWRSWLVRGAYIITGFGLLLPIYFLARLLGSSAPVLQWLLLIFGFLSAVYTAFLFAQAKGRDSWQSPLLPLVMGTHAVILGAACFGLLTPWISPDWTSYLQKALGIGLLVHLLAELSEHWLTHSSKAAAMVSHEITRGKFSRLFWLNLLFGAVVPLLICFFAPPLWLPLAAVLAGVGTYVSQHVLIFAGQQLPLS